MPPTIGSVIGGRLPGKQRSGSRLAVSQEEGGLICDYGKKGSSLGEGRREKGELVVVISILCR